MAAVVVAVAVARRGGASACQREGGARQHAQGRPSHGGGDAQADVVAARARLWANGKLPGKDMFPTRTWRRNAEQVLNYLSTREGKVVN